MLARCATSSGVCCRSRSAATLARPAVGSLFLFRTKIDNLNDISSSNKVGARKDSNCRPRIRRRGPEYPGEIFASPSGLRTPGQTRSTKPYEDRLSRRAWETTREERMTGVLDDYLVDPQISLLDKTRIQAQVLVPMLRALRAELGKDKA